MHDTHDRVTSLEQALVEAEAALRAERKAHLAFISLLTHELRVPITSIMGYTDLLIKGIMGPINEPQAGFLNTIRANTERMTRMVADLSDINKANGEALKLSLEAVELAPLLQEAVEALSSALDEKEQAIEVALPADLPPARGDCARLKLVFQRLLENAIQYTPSGGTVTVAAHLDGATETLLVSIQDTGIGIPEDEQDRIGEMFFRASDEKTRETTGNGLSLHLCQQLLALHKGGLRFESSRDAGSTFYLTLPAYTATEGL